MRSKAIAVLLMASMSTLARPFVSPLWQDLLLGVQLVATGFGLYLLNCQEETANRRERRIFKGMLLFVAGVGFVVAFSAAMDGAYLSSAMMTLGSGVFTAVGFKVGQL